MKQTRWRWIVVVFLGAVSMALQFGLQHNENFVRFYILHIYLPLQSARNALLNRISFSIGDIFYLLAALLFLLLLIRLIYFTCTLRRNKQDLIVEGLRMATFMLLLYLSFLILWGGNYYRKPLTANWHTNAVAWDTSKLIRLNEFLIEKINETVISPEKFPSLKQINRQADNYYHEIFGSCFPRVKVKATALGYLLNYAGIHGYYNPWSGESQFNRFIPPFMHPFVISHEMAHQTGIAAEDDANLVAYLIGVQSDDRAFQYSSYFNLFLYAYGDLKIKDSCRATEILGQLNQQSRMDLETLRAMYRKYKGQLRGFSNSLYDEYLKLHGQSKGLHSYNQVTHWVYYWEFVADRQALIRICP